MLTDRFHRKRRLSKMGEGFRGDSRGGKNLVLHFDTFAIPGPTVFVCFRVFFLFFILFFFYLNNIFFLNICSKSVLMWTIEKDTKTP